MKKLYLLRILILYVLTAEYPYIKDHDMNISDMLFLVMSSLDAPITIIFLITGMFLTFYFIFPQFRYIHLFFKLLQQKNLNESSKNTLSPLQALLTAMSTSIGMGNIAGPPLAIAIGGPGALLWLLIYTFFGAATKFVEVTLAVFFKEKTPDGTIIGGPSVYLKKIHPYLGYWYAFITMFLLAGWSSLQSRTLAEVYAKAGVPELYTGIVTAIFIFYMLMGGAKRIAEFSSLLVPIMCSIYFCASMLILFHNIPALTQAFSDIFIYAFTPMAAIGGFAGSTVLMAARQGIFKGVFITEAGVGTAGIPHALAQTEIAKHQGILALYSLAVDAFFCTLSGLIALVTGVWKSGKISNALIFDAFSITFPTAGPIILTISITLFVISTALGNSFNGSKSFASFTRNQYIIVYYAFASILILLGAITQTPTLWAIMDIMLPLVAIPNLLGCIYLIIRYKKALLL